MAGNGLPRQEQLLNSSPTASKKDEGDYKRTVESGGGVNPYIPMFISKAPWYLASSTDLQHQRVTEQTKTGLDIHHKRGVIPQVAIKYRKNACENCGAITHDAKNCVERPRKKGAKFTSENICPDEYIVQHSEGGYDAVRDRWAGFDPESHLILVESHKAAEAEQERRRAQKLAEQLLKEAEGGDKNDKTGYNKEYSAAGDEVTFDTKDDNTRTTTRNLRIRDDTAKYLINLDVDSAHYDPKSRSLRENPLLGMKDTGVHTFRGDNEIFTSGEAGKPKEMEIFAWESQKKGVEVNFMAQPTELEFMFKEQQALIEKEKTEKRNALLERFGGSEFLHGEKEEDSAVNIAGDKTSTTGLPTAKVTASSIYEEDTYVGGHSAVWGSYYDKVNRLWGYKCCKGTSRNANCTLT